MKRIKEIKPTGPLHCKVVFDDDSSYMSDWKELEILKIEDMLCRHSLSDDVTKLIEELKEAVAIHSAFYALSHIGR